MITSADFDTSVSEHIAGPYPLFRRLRAEAPAFWSDHLHAWVLTRYADVRAALADESRFSSAGSLLATTLAPDVRELLGSYSTLPNFPANTDPPAHTRLRRSVSRAFTPRAVAALEQLFIDEAHRVLDALPARGTVDIRTAFAHVLPVKVTAALIGIPAEDELRVKAWVEDWFQLFRTPAPPERQRTLAREFLDYVDYVRGLLELRRREPRDDLVSTLAATAGAAVSLEELVELVASLLLGGNETVSSLLTTTIRRLLDTKGLWPAIEADRARVPDAIEEVLRIDGASLGDYRFTTTDVEIAGQHLPAGNRVITYRDAANHDDAVFADPEIFDVERPNLRMHLAFGHGIHHCVGAALTRVEVRAAVNVLADRLPDLRLVPGQQLRFRPAILNRSLEALHVEWENRR